MMSKTAILWVILLGLTPLSSFAGSIPGQDISSYANVIWCEQAQINAGASVSYVDPSGNPAVESSDVFASVQAEISLSPATAGPAKSYVAPAPNAAVYFTSSRSLYSGASLVGKNVKLVGKVRTINGALYLDDGAAVVSIDPATGSSVVTPTLVLLSSDLLTNRPADGTFVTIQGVCRRESDGRLSLLPLSDAALSRVQ